MYLKQLQNKRLWFVYAIVVACLLVVAAGFVRPSVAGDMACPDNWYESSDSAVLERCSEQKVIRAATEEQLARQQAEATPYYQTDPNSFSVPELPQPPDTRIIRDLLVVPTDPGEIQGRPGILINATSAWQVGSVPAAEYTSWEPLWVITYPGNGASYTVGGGSPTFTVPDNPALVTFPLNADQYAQTNFARRWTCPQPLVSLKITGVQAGSTPGIGADGVNFAGLNYIVSFEAENGTTGTFNMATEAWTFDASNSSPSP
jgi:hypothetical protein